MQLHQLRPVHKPKKPKRVGRGGGHGTYCGRGRKGQSSRAGHKFAPIIRELIKRYPKLRGYRAEKMASNQVIVNLETLEKKFQESETINPQILLEKRIIRRIKGKTPQVKILGRGELKKSLTIEDCSVSQSAREAIEKSGGKIITFEDRKK